MKKFLFAIMAIAALFSFAACNDTETYKDLRDRELDSISSFLRHENVKVISEEEFKSRWEKKQKDNSVVLTDTSKNNNEYVLFNSNGIYMQVLEMGCGDYIKMGETTDVLVRFSEYNLNTAAEMSDKSLQLSNNLKQYSFYTDKMTVTNTSGTFTGTFDVNSSLGERIAHVRLVVPHTYGTTAASGSVYACLYDLTLQRGR